MTPGARQKAHYERINADYEAHYYDEASMRYRRRFMYDPLVAGIDLNGLLVADLACGSGHNSIELKRRFPAVRTHGYDVSPSSCTAYRARTGEPAFECDLTRPAAFAERYDAALVFGGLHHCVGNMPQTMANVALLLKPGGLFLMVEPNRRFVFEPLRALWYRLDPYFDAETERALDHDALAASEAATFGVEYAAYGGGPAYFAVLNSLILRVPRGLKRAITPPLLAFEQLWNYLPGRVAFPYFIARWRRR
jgi:SAM-dependent methyltransferase